MKRFLASAALVFAVAAMGLADETTEIYQMLYKQAAGLQQKYNAAVNLVGLEDKATAPILAQALEELLLAQSVYSLPSEQDLYGHTLRILAQALGDYKYIPAAPFLWDVARYVPDALAKGEAMIAIGKMRALDYVERVSLKLRDLNNMPPADSDSGEKVAYSTIIALEKFKDVRGFSSVFFATDAWYSQRVRQQAVKSLPGICDDPTDAIIEIMKFETPVRRLRALQAEADSKAAESRKIEAAVFALNLGHLKVPIDKREARAFGEYRKLALRMLTAYKAVGTAPIDGCNASYERGFDDEERLLALQALGANGSDPAAMALGDIITKLNENQKDGVADETRNRMARAAIENCAVAKNRIVRTVLLAVSSNNTWSNGIILAAQNAIKALP